MPFEIIDGIDKYKAIDIIEDDNEKIKLLNNYFQTKNANEAFKNTNSQLQFGTKDVNAVIEQLEVSNIKKIEDNTKPDFKTYLINKIKILEYKNKLIDNHKEKQQNEKTIMDIIKTLHTLDNEIAKKIIEKKNDVVNELMERLKQMER